MSNRAEHYERRLYGRRIGRPLTASLQNILDDLLPQLQIPAEDVHKGTTLDAGSLFGHSPPALWLEIGFGTGEHLAGLMRRNREHGYLGAEPFVNGMGGFLKRIKDEPHENIRVWMDDAIPLVDALADGIVDGIYVLNPDPWPKKRHHKRRIVNQENLWKFARVLKPGGLLIMSTDVSDLADWMVTQTMTHPAFGWTVETADDWRLPPPDWITTRYEEKGAEAGRQQTYLIFRRVKALPAVAPQPVF